MNKKKVVYVAMSGGVDSAVSALLLKEQGYIVRGIFIKTWTPDYIECTQKEDRLDALRVCSELDIPFETLDLEREYKEFVIDYFLNEYKNNNVPNPDIMCNKFIKFGGLFDYCITNGGDYLATGHYAKIIEMNKDLIKSVAHSKKTISKKLLYPEGSDTIFYKCFFWVGSVLKNKTKSKFTEYFYEAIDKYMLDIGHYMRKENVNIEKENTDDFYLSIPRDKNKDQTYFLYQIERNKLNKIIFPLADLEKSEVREIARKNNLWVQDKKDSQGICMLGGEIDVKDFLLRELSLQAGDVLDENNNVIGRHNGVQLYTLGERRGFQIFNDKTDSHSHYIIEKRLDKNQLVVSENYNNLKLKDKYYLREVNYLIDIDNNINVFDDIVLARFRYRGDFIKVKYNIKEKSVEIIENKNDFIPISGQSVVFYKDNIVLGGGVIVNSME